MCVWLSGRPVAEKAAGRREDLAQVAAKGQEARQTPARARLCSGDGAESGQKK